MKKLRLFLSITFILTFVTSSVFAGDFANLRFIGFSKDGNYLAFEEWGEGDPGGWYSNTYFIDVANNSYALKPVTLLDEDGKHSLEFLRQKGANLSAKNLRKLGINQGNTGQMVLAHLQNDWTYKDGFGVGGSGEKVKFNNYINPNSPNLDDFYELNLETFLDETADCPDREFFPVYKLGLTLNYNSYDRRNNHSQVMQKDSILPKRRDCPTGYGIESVYFYDDMVAVFLQVFSRGFEGPNMRYMVVTTQLDYAPFGQDYFKYRK